MYPNNQNQQLYRQSYSNSNNYVTPYPQQAYEAQQYMPINTGNFLKGRPVVSIEEARAASIDMDGSLHIFTDIGNKKIYTKQINLDGTATLNVYSLDNNVQQQSNLNFITREEFNTEMAKIQTVLNNMFIQKPNEEKEKTSTVSLNDF